MGLKVAYQTPYTNSPYGPGIPSSAAPQVPLPANYMMAGPMAPYQMNAAMAPQQPMMQRMHPSQQNPAGMNVSTPQRPFNPGQSTPNHPMPSQPSQFPTPQPHGTPQSQTSANTQQPQSTVATPQTPTFPSTNTGQQSQANGTSTTSAPQSPATESRDQERFAVLFDINQELLYESLCLMNSRAELKKEQAAVQAGEGISEVDFAEEEKLLSHDYNQCVWSFPSRYGYITDMRRIDVCAG